MVAWDQEKQLPSIQTKVGNVQPNIKRKYERYIFQFFRMACIVIAIWMSIDQIIRYLENEDKASVTYKKFHDSPRDRYPTYSICFEVKKRPIAKFSPTNFYNDTYLQNNFNMTKLDYLSLLWGDFSIQASSKELKKKFNEADLSKIDYEEAAKHPKNVISDYLVGYNTGIHSRIPRKLMKAMSVIHNQSWINPEEFDLKMTMVWKNLKDEKFKESFSKEFPFYKSYQDDVRICLTRYDVYRHEITRDFEHITHWTWKNDYFDKIAIFMHHPGQGVRHFFQKFQSKALTERNTRKLTEKDFNVMKFSINHVSVLRNRPDANKPCDPYHIDDEKMYSAIFRIIPCVPPFWKIFRPKQSNKSECKTGFEIQEAMKIVKQTQWGDATPFISQPCDKMTVSANIERTKTDGKYADKLMLLRFHFVSEDYQEIVNLRDFGFEAFWSSIGGFMGMFLGYSCLQITELMMDGIYSARMSYFVK